MQPEAVEQASDVRYLKGVGPKRAEVLAKLGIHSVRDLLFYFPRRYEDRSQFKPIAKLVPSETVTIHGEILSVKLKRIRRMQILELVVGDESAMIHAIWFNQAYLKKQFVEGKNIILYGKVDLYKGRLQIGSPEYEVFDTDEESVHVGRITPIYPLTEGLFQRSLRATLKEAVSNYLVREVNEFYPKSFLEEKNFMELPQAVSQMHFPESEELQQSAERRLAFDEFLFFELVLFQKLENLKKKYQSLQVDLSDADYEKFCEQLPFTMTEDQEKAVGEIREDLKQSVPMNRLVQGDVGSGKTVVAALSLFASAKAGYQGALLVPTEILAEQHFKTVNAWLEALGVKASLLTAATPNAKRERIIAEVKTGKIQVLIGTHALLQEDVKFKDLATVVVDEQHKFGVHQRSKLLQMNPRPHQIVMTATPIPRTLAFTVFGDLAISSIKTLPKGRKPIKTYWIERGKQLKVFNHMRDKIKSGEQAYFIFPLIDETEKMDLLAAEKEYERLKKKVFKEFDVGLVHGRMSKEERDEMMKRFRQGEIQILVATSVIEVGVDHPNATMMVIENAERFGLAQLHQMRGRIGRGELESECFLFGEPSTDTGKKRLRILTKTQDGFKIAEEDLRLRGSGDFLGTRQSGEPYFRVADPIEDEHLLCEARDLARHLVQGKVLDTEEPWFELRQRLQEIVLNY